MSSRSSGALVWIKSRASEDVNCVEVATEDGTTVYVRDSKAGAASPVLAFTTGEWNAFLTGVHDGEFTLEALTPRLVSTGPPTG